MRSEFLSAFLSHDGAAQLIDDELLVGPLDRSRLAEVIERPAERAGVDFTAGLIGRMVEDTAGGDALPLLSHTLAELYEGARGPAVRAVADRQYDDLGGVVGALQRSADRELRRLDGRGLGDAVIPTLTRMVAFGPDGQVTRRRLPRRALSARANEIVDTFIEARLLASNQVDGQPVVEVAHEALLRQWPPLREVIAARHDELLLRSEIERAARDWDRAGRRDDYLLTGERLEAAQRLAARHDESQSGLEQRELAFVDASDKRRQRAEAARRRPLAAVIALAALAIGLALYLWNPGTVQQLELSTIDTRFSIRGSSAPDPRIVLVAVDDRTLRRFDAGQTAVLSRGEYAPLLRRIHQDGPAVIALDVIFQGRRDPQDDRALLAAIRDTSDRLVLPFINFATGTNEQTGQATVSPTLFGRPGAVEARGVTTGYVVLPDDRDGVDRRADYEAVAGKAFELQARPPPQRPDTGNDDLSMPTFAFAAANLVRHGALARHIDDLPTAPQRARGGQTDRTTWIDFHGPGGTVRRVSAIDVLDGRVPAREFRDKAVVIGVVAPAAGDIHRTPVDDDMPGAELQADAIDTILRGSPLRDVPPLVDIAIIALLACAPVAAALWWSTPVVAGVVAACAVLLLGAAQLAFQSGWIVAVVAPFGALLVAAYCVATLAAMQGLARRSRDRD